MVSPTTAIPAAAPLPAMTGQRAGLTQLWLVAVGLGALGTAIGFAAMPGINWGIWTAAAALAPLPLLRRSRGSVPRAVVLLLLLAPALASGAAITANPPIQFLILVATVATFAIAAVITSGRDVGMLGPVRLALAPIEAALLAGREALARVVQTSGLADDARSMAVIRGTALALPIVGVLALLLSTADPVLGAARESVLALLQDSLFVPRAVFFVGLTTLSVGACGLALRPLPAAPRPASPLASPERRGVRLGDTERLIVLGATAALFALFLLLQLSYLFGAVPAMAGSGMTYAEYARRGFGELTVAATVATLLVVGLDHVADPGPAHGRVRVMAYVLIALVQLLLGSAWHRLGLYERAYGFTQARVYAHAYMVVVSLVLVALDVEIARRVDLGRLVRSAALIGALAIVALAWWNHDAWIVRQNVARYANTGRLDVAYLGRDLSMDALPALREALPRLSAPDRAALVACLAHRYRGGRAPGAARWFEYNRSRVRARLALDALGIGAGGDRPAVGGESCPAAPRDAGR